MAARILKYSVYLPGPDGETVCLLAGTEAPSWAKGKIGDHAFEDGESSSEPETVAIPPKSGKGSGIGAWTKYADTNEVEYADDATRDDIIAALDAAGVPTEADGE